MGSKGKALGRRPQTAKYPHAQKSAGKGEFSALLKRGETHARGFPFYVIYSERRTQNIEFLGKISNDSKNGYGINRSNKQEVVSQYIPSFNPMYDEVVNRDRNAGSIILASNNYFITAIEEYKVDDLRYDFNGVIISRFKVLRIYETLIKNRMAGTYNAILYAICKNSILTEEQYRNITACLDRTFGNLKGVARG